MLQVGSGFPNAVQLAQMKGPDGPNEGSKWGPDEAQMNGPNAFIWTGPNSYQTVAIGYASLNLSNGMWTMPSGPTQKNQDLTARLAAGEDPHQLIREGHPKSTVNRLAERVERGDYAPPHPGATSATPPPLCSG